MDLSIIITAFKRAHLLKWNLLSLAKQTKNFTYEILVLNDGVEDDTEEVCRQFKDLNIRYIFTGQRNKSETIWRVPGFTINIGLKQALGKNIIISCAEMYLVDDILKDYVAILKKKPKSIVITEGYDDRSGIFLKMLNTMPEKLEDRYIYKQTCHKLNTELPFFMGINKDIMDEIGGYDEDFIGYCWDDNDIVNRLVKYGCEYHKLVKDVVHLYHTRQRIGLANRKQEYDYNQNLFNLRKNIIARNINKDWGLNGFHTNQ